jgi:hypothetical protein
MSFCCVPKRVLKEIGSEPFRVRVAEDCYFCNLIVFYGPIVRVSTPLTAYRIRENSLSSDLVKLSGAAVQSLELLEEQFARPAHSQYYNLFGQVHASRRRYYAKVLLGAGKAAEARKQLKRSLANSVNFVSRTKSLALLFWSYLPRPLQPTWPASHRVWKAHGSL